MNELRALYGGWIGPRVQIAPYQTGPIHPCSMAGLSAVPACALILSGLHETYPSRALELTKLSVDCP
jgi:hypothetical protein